MKKRAAVYVDAFNLYYAIVEIGKPHYKWLKLWKLSENIIPSKDEDLVKVAFCSAYTGDTGQRSRHEKYVKALEALGVECVMGHYVREPTDCRNCGRTWNKSTEKETDINVALSIYDDAHQGVFDHAYLISADSDQAATARMFESRFPNKRLVAVSPPGRPHSQHILKYAHSKISLNEDHLDRAVLPGVVTAPSGAIVLRPIEYAPPDGWVPFDQRPKKT